VPLFALPESIALSEKRVCHSTLLSGGKVTLPVAVYVKKEREKYPRELYFCDTVGFY